MFSNIIAGIFGLLPQLAITGICIYFVTKKPCAESYLMIIGSILGLLPNLFFSILMPLLYNFDFWQIAYQNFIIVARVIGIIGSVFFAIGLILLVINTINNSNKNKNLIL